MKRLILTFICLTMCAATFAQSWEQNYADRGFAVQDTTICGRHAIFVIPQNANGRWIARPAFIGAFAQVDDALLERGWSFGLLDLMDEYATPQAQAAFTEFCNYARDHHNLSEKVVLEGLSRGGWFSLVYAENNPDRVEKLYIDAPLCDLHGFERVEPVKVAAKLWQEAGIEPEQFYSYAKDHFDRIKDIPIFVVYGSVDHAVPFEKQLGTFDLSGCKEISIIGKTGCDHHPHSLMPCDTIVNFLTKPRALPREKVTFHKALCFENYLNDVSKAGNDIHSIMVLQHGKVLFEQWMSEGAPDKPHALWSCSKTFCSAAVGFAITEGYLTLDTRIIDIFPEFKPRKVSKNLKAMTVRDLLTMTCGHETDPTYEIWNTKEGWIRQFLAKEVKYEPGTAFCYNSLGTYVLSAAVQKLTGQKIVDYLTPRLFEPLGISKPRWDESPEGVCCGGWGLYLKTEDLARMGQCLLQGGKWEGRQVIPAWWAKEIGSKQVESIPGGQPASKAPEFQSEYYKENNDWCQGYGYQMWRCRFNGYRADGANSQYIMVFPDMDAVIITTAHDDNMQRVLNQVYDNIFPALR